MHILCTGLNHQTASVSVRERLAFGEQDLKKALSLFETMRGQNSLLSELIIISTCNRVELYAVSENLSFDALDAFLAHVRGLILAEFSEHLYHLADQQAIDHLFRVSAGLDSLILGEAQILGQVSHALDEARSKETVGPVLSRLFQAALFTGKRARSETAIGHNPASISSIAVSLASRTLPDLTCAQVAVLGAGEMAELAVEALLKRGAMSIRVVNRHIEKAQRLASRWEGAACTFDSLPQVLEQADIIICSTGAPHALIHPEMVRAAMLHRQGRPLVLIDIAVPRDVHPQVGHLPGIDVYDIDSLQERLAGSLASRQKEVPKVEVILEEEKDAFQRYLDSFDVLPLIAEIHQKAEALRQAELEKTLRRLPHLTEEERCRIDALTNALVSKILSNPLVCLRSQSSGRSADYALIARELFGLGD
jgi:glutamyl-tRNA reductase